MTGRNPITDRCPDLDVETLVWSPDSAQIASCSSKRTLSIWDVATGNDVMEYHGHKEVGFGSVIAWSPTGQYVASTEDILHSTGCVHIWKADTGELVTTYHGILGM